MVVVDSRITLAEKSINYVNTQPKMKASSSDEIEINFPPISNTSSMYVLSLWDEHGGQAQHQMNRTASFEENKTHRRKKPFTPTKDKNTHRILRIS